MLLRTLGGLELASSFTRPKPLLLLAYLALEGPKERRHLAELFFPEATDPLNRLAVTLVRVRKADPGMVGVDKVRVWTDLATDAKELLTAIERGKYDVAVSLYRGSFLEGVYFEDWRSELEEWVYGTRDFLASQVKTAQLALAEAEAGEGRFQDAAKRAEAAYLVARTAGLEPGDVARLHTLMLAGGNPRTLHLQEEAETFGTKLLTTSDEARDTLRRAFSARRVIPSNLSGRSSSFVGRDLELAELAAMLANPDARLISVVGPAGVGKTRLALEAARQQLTLEQFKDGVYFVPLDALSNAFAIPNKLAEALGLPLQGTAAPLTQLGRHIGAKDMLLALDNYEHLLDGVSLAADLLQTCPNLKLLVTSRERLNLNEEWLFTVGGLSFANEKVELEHLLAHDAVSLFQQRAKQAQPAFSLTQENAPGVQAICRLVEGSPLGLELAAVWTRVMSPSDIAKEVAQNLDFLTTSTRNVSDRHKSLRAAFEHSWRLLTLKEQEVLRKLSVFRGGFTREAGAEAVGATIPMLASLLDKSLLRVSEQGRYDRHPLLYQYTQEKLAEYPEEKAEAEAKHAAYFSGLDEHLKLVLKGGEPGRAYARLEAELENFRAAWHWALENKSVKTIDACASAFGWYFFERWQGDEPIQLYTSALAALDEANPAHQATVGGLLGHLGFEYAIRGRLDEAEAFAERGLALLRPIWEGRKDLMGMDDCVIALASVALERGRFEQSLAYVLEQEALGLVHSQGAHLSNLGILETHAGNYAAAKAYLLRALEHSRKENNLLQIVRSLNLLGNAHLRAGEAEVARRCHREAVALVRKHGSVGATDGFALLHLGEVALELGEVQEAQSAARDLLGEHPDPDRFHALAFELLGRIATATGDYSGAERYFRQYIEATLEQFGDLAAVNRDAFRRVLLHVCDLRLKQGRVQEAAAVFGFLSPRCHNAYDKGFLERLLAELRALLPAKALEQALSEAQNIDLEDIVRDFLRQASSGEGQLG